MYSIVIQYFYILYSIKSYYKLKAIMPCAEFSSVQSLSHV